MHIGLRYQGIKSMIIIRELIPIIGFFDERGQWTRLVQTRQAMPREALASPYICHFSKLNIDFDFALNFVSQHCIASVSLLKTSKNFGRHF